MPDFIKSISPSTEEVIGEVPITTEEEIQISLQEAWSVQGRRPGKKAFENLKNLIAERSIEIARTIAQEQGKPVIEALASEVYPGLSAIEFLLEKGDEVLREKERTPFEVMFAGRRGRILRQGYGLSLVISTWNYPFAIPFLDTIASVFAGSPVILRPSTQTPMVALLIQQLFKEAGFDPGYLQVFITDHKQVNKLIEHPHVRRIFFTGSVEVGRKIGEAAGRNLKKAILELGGKDAMIVFADADLKRAARGATWAGFMNAGQTCASVERILVEEKITDEFLYLLLEEVKKIRVGSPLDENTDMGPLISEVQREKVLNQIENSDGEILTGGKKIGDRGFFMSPAIVLEPREDSALWSEETFGPVVAVRKFSTEQEAIAMANSCNYGLSASVWTRDRKKALRVAKALEAGSITINDHLSSYAEPSAPWGGVKSTGFGRSHGEYALVEAVEEKYIMEDFSRRKKLLWWFPYNSNGKDIIYKSAQMLYGSRRVKSLLGILPHMPRLIKEVGFAGLISALGRIFGL